MIARALLLTGGIAAAMAGLAGWSLWKLAGAKDRCELRLNYARAEGKRMVDAFIAERDEELNAALLAAMKHSADLDASSKAKHVERVTVYRDRVKVAPESGCTADPEFVEALNDSLR